MRIAIVNDMRMAVEILRRIVVSVPSYQLLWIARDGAEAVQKCALQVPDLILMDLIMPVMDGVEATRQIMAKNPCAILVVTANVRANAHKVYEAMGYGALDAVDTPVFEGAQIKDLGARILLTKISTIAQLVKRTVVSSQTVLIRKPSPKVAATANPMIAIGASTGGPKAISIILAGLPADIPASIVIIQHIDKVFADGLAEWLGQQTRLRVRTAKAGTRPEVGVVDVAATDDHLVLREDTFVYTEHPIDLPYRPSVNVFYKSIASSPKGAVMGVLLTGIGLDGGEGMLKLRQGGHHTIAEDQSTCVVYGMPKAAVDLKAAVEVLPVDQIAPAILRSLPQISSQERTTIEN